MKKFLIAGLGICLILGFVSLSMAKQSKVSRAYVPDPIQEDSSASDSSASDSSTSSNSFECSYPDPVTNLGPEEIHTFSITWDVVKTRGPAKFQGYAKFAVFNIEQEVVDGDPLSFSHKTVDVDLMPAQNPDYILGETPGYFLYSCSGGREKTCTAELVGFAQAINIQLAAIYGGSPEDFSWESATFLGIFFEDNEVCGVYEEEDQPAESGTEVPPAGSDTEEPPAGIDTSSSSSTGETAENSDPQSTEDGSSVDSSSSSHNTQYYLDADATGTGTGLSVENAFTSFAAVAASGFGSGDTLWMSGGSTSKIYSLSADYWCPSGTTYKVNQQEGHNGVVIIDSGDIPKLFQIRNRSNITIDGEVDGERHIRFQNWVTSPGFVAIATSGSGTTVSGIDGLRIRYIEIISDDATCEEDNCSDIAVRYSAYLKETGGGTLIEHNYFEGCCMNFSP